MKGRFYSMLKNVRGVRKRFSVSMKTVSLNVTTYMFFLIRLGLHAQLNGSLLNHGRKGTAKLACQTAKNKII